MRATPTLAAATALLFLATACGGSQDPDEDELRQQLVDQLQDGGEGFSQEASECFADLLIEEIGVERLQDVDLTDTEPPADLADEIATATVRAGDECDLTDAPE
jgi:hypothetical protein